MITRTMIENLWADINSRRLARGMKLVTSDSVVEIASRFSEALDKNGDPALTMIKRGIEGVVEGRGFNDDGTITIIASDETVDRYGDVIEAKGWDLANFKKNPVILIDHSYSVDAIVGHAKRARIEKVDLAKMFDDQSCWTLDACIFCSDEWCGFDHSTCDYVLLGKKAHVARRLVLDVMLDDGGENPTAGRVRSKIESRSLRATSVGFIPLIWNKILNEDDEWTGGFVFEKSELLEDSFVAVPANPNALVPNAASIVTPEPCSSVADAAMLEKIERTLTLHGIAQKFGR